jgi:hypothetical protein
MNKRVWRWAACWLVCLAPGAARAQSPAVSGPKDDWHWSAFVMDVFDGERAAGVRRRLGHAGALFASASFDREQRDFGDPVSTVTRFGLTAGYRRWLGEQRLRGLLEIEGKLTRSHIDAPDVSGDRDGAGGGAYLGFEYFFSPSFSFSARAGVAYESRDEAGGGQTRQFTALRPGVAVSAYW